MRSRLNDRSASRQASTTPTQRTSLSPTRPDVRSWLTFSALGTVYLVWGSTYLGMRVVATSLPAFGSAAARYGVAGAALAAIVAARLGVRALRITVRQILATTLVGTLLLGGGNGLIMLAESPSFGLPSGIAALLVALNPLLLVGLRAATGDRPRPSTIIGAMVGLAGLVLLFLPGLGNGRSNGLPIAGAVLVLVAVGCWSTGSFISQWLPLPANPFVTSAYEMLFGAAAMGVIALGRGEPAIWAVPDVPMRAWLSMLYLIVFGSLVAFTAYIWLLHHAPISLASTYAYVNPVIAVALGAALLGEALPAQTALASATVIIGVALVVSTERIRHG